MRTNFMKVIAPLLSLVLIFTLPACSNSNLDVSSPVSSENNSSIDSAPISATNPLTSYQGKWEGIDGFSSWTLNINSEIDIPNVLLSNSEFRFFYDPMNWEITNEQLVFTMNNEEHQATFVLNLSNNETLTGTYEQYGETTVGSFSRISVDADNKEFYREYGEKAKGRIALLADFEEYEDDGISIPFTYTLYQREENQEVLEKYNLDSITEGLSDVQLLEVLLNWVCDNVRHDGSVGLPEQRDIDSLIQHARENNGINCRGMSIILADLCRIYGIDAKHITCMPKEADFDDCHVVVHAYSEELGQWIMLDPTYRLILKTDTGQYVNLQMFRQSYFDGTVLIPNNNAGWNGGVFDIHEHKSYMSEHLFRFSCATDFYSGAEDGRHGNTRNMLVPVNYSEDSAELTTTSDTAFWAIPDGASL